MKEWKDETGQENSGGFYYAPTMFAQRFAVGFRIRDSRIIAMGISISIANC